MCGRRKMLLVAVTFTALYYTATAQRPVLLNMAPDAVDDRYSGCHEEAMKKFIHSGLIKDELNKSKEFQKAWDQSAKCEKLINGGIQEHTTALLAFAHGQTDFVTAFNNEVKTQGVNMSTYEDQFHFKSLHFLLMDSIRLLHSGTDCKNVYWLVSEEKYLATPGSDVRFGGFTKVYTSFNVLKSLHDFEDVMIFNITTCYFADLGDNICGVDKDMALISPAELFTVEKSEAVTDQVDESDYTLVTMKHSTLLSSHNCFIFSRSPADISTQWLVMLLATLTLFCLH